MSSEDLQKRLARQESLHDMLITEMEELETLLKTAGFPKGIQSCKEVALELLREEQADLNDQE